MAHTVCQIELVPHPPDNEGGKQRRTKEDNPTIGILLCTETDKIIAKYSVLSENKQLFASKYLSYLPTEKELTAEIERQRILIKMGELTDKN